MERRDYRNEEPGAEGSSSLEFDIATGCLRSAGSGLWSIKQCSAFFVDWKQAVSRIHASGGAVSGFVDVSEGLVQKAEVAALIATATASIYRQGDAIAILVSTNLAKMQMRRLHDPRFHEFFVSRNAAELWLTGRAGRADYCRQVLTSAA